MNTTSDANVDFKKLFLEANLFLAVIFATWMLPVLVHMIPWSYSVPIGVVLIPIFYAPSIAILFNRHIFGLLSVVFVPLLNYTLTGRPAVYVVNLLIIQLVLFTLFSYVIFKKNRLFIFNLPISYFTVKSLTIFIFMIFPEVLNSMNIPNYLSSFKICLPGIVILGFINWICVKKIKK